jgi:hypothetical protein
VLLWKVLVEAARAERIDRDRRRALAWIHQHIPELSVTPLGDDGRPFVRAGRVYRDDTFDWEVQWETWRDNFKGLLWLAERREHPPDARSGKDVIPIAVSRVFDDIIKRTRNAVLSDYFSEAKLVVQFSGTFNASRRFESLDEFWEAVFVSFFGPDALPHGSVCSECGESLTPTKKLRKLSKAKLCGNCRLRQWRRNNPERQRELWREAKSKERNGVR